MRPTDLMGALLAVGSAGIGAGKLPRPRSDKAAYPPANKGKGQATKKKRRRRQAKESRRANRKRKR